MSPHKRHRAAAREALVAYQRQRAQLLAKQSTPLSWRLLVDSFALMTGFRRRKSDPLWVGWRG